MRRSVVPKMLSARRLHRGSAESRIKIFFEKKKTSGIRYPAREYPIPDCGVIFLTDLWGELVLRARIPVNYFFVKSEYIYFFFKPISGLR